MFWKWWAFKCQAIESWVRRLPSPRNKNHNFNDFGLRWCKKTEPLWLDKTCVELQYFNSRPSGVQLQTLWSWTYSKEFRCPCLAQSKVLMAVIFWKKHQKVARVLLANGPYGTGSPGNSPIWHEWSSKQSKMACTNLEHKLKNGMSGHTTQGRFLTGWEHRFPMSSNSGMSCVQVMDVVLFAKKQIMILQVVGGRLHQFH